ncbi:MAG: hypothetical protein HFG27_08610 [Provencibacterium sp.]|jgi:hypothetical protein|nr:hypothetical protein [Provencibacterium sp.]
MSYLATMLDMLTGAYIRSDLRRAQEGNPPQTNIGKLLSIYADGLETVHAALDTVRLWDDLDRSVGTTLERYGANFGVARENAPDIIYRVMIKVKMMAQLSGGDIDTVIRAASALFDVDEQDILLRELFPAKIRILVDSASLDEEHRSLLPTILRFFKRIVAAGVGFDMGPRIEVATTVYAAAYAVSGHRYSIVAIPLPHKQAIRAESWGGAVSVSGHRYSINARDK